MKLLMVTALEEYQEAIAHVFRDQGIKAYSAGDIQGFSNNGSDKPSTDNWFGHESRIPKGSVMIFSFTEEQTATAVLEALQKLNGELDPAFPVRAFILPVERAL